MMNGLSALGRRTDDPPISWLMQMTLDNPGLISLAAGFTDSISLPVTLAGDLLREILAEAGLGHTALQYGSTEGDPELRRITCERLARMDGFDSGMYRPEQMLITHGSQQL